MTESKENMGSVRFVHTISESGRLLPSSSRWNSIELDFNCYPQSSNYGCDSLPSRYSRTIDFNIVIRDRRLFRRFIVVLVSLLVAFLMIILLLSILSHRKHVHGSSKDLSSALRQALVFFDAQKSGPYPKDSPVKFRGDSGLDDGNMGTAKPDLVGGFYDSGNNIKFSFPTAYTVTLLSWTVIEYHDKYAAIGELDHIKNIIRWGSHYLLKLFVPSNASSAVLYSQVGSPGSDSKDNDYYKDNDIRCWQRPEDMSYSRPVSACDATAAADLAGEIVAGMSAASLVFKEERDFSLELVQSAELLFNLATINTGKSKKQGTYTSIDDCGGLARQFYNSSGYKDELIWAGVWLFFATGNSSYLDYATDNFASAEEEEFLSEKEIFSWDNKLPAIAILLTRLRFFRDIGYPYEATLRSSTIRTECLIMSSYTSKQSFPKTKGGLILLKPETSAPLQYAATASFLTKLYSDYLELMHRTGSRCGDDDSFSVQNLRDFSRSQVMYILGDNPMKISYLVGFGDKFPTHVHHRSASIPWDGKWHTCEEGEKCLNTLNTNPNTITGAMVAGPDKNDKFLDDRSKKWFTEARIWSNAGLVAALVAIHDPPKYQSSSDTEDGVRLGIDKIGLFENIQFVPSAS